MKNNSLRDIGFYVLVFIILISTVVLLSQSAKPEEPIYSEVVEYFQKEQVDSFVVEGNVLTLYLKNSVRPVEHQLYDVGMFYNDLGDLIKQQRKDGTLKQYNYKQGYVAPWWMVFVPYAVLF